MNADDALCLEICYEMLDFRQFMTEVMPTRGTRGFKRRRQRGVGLLSEGWRSNEWNQAKLLL